MRESVHSMIEGVFSIYKISSPHLLHYKVLYIVELYYYYYGTCSEQCENIHQTVITHLIEAVLFANILLAGLLMLFILIYHKHFSN